MKSIYSLVLFLLVHLAVQAQSKYEYLSTAQLPAELREHAVAIVRYDSSTFTLINQSSFRETQKKAITILKAEGSDYGKIVEYYSDLVNLKELKATLIAADGKVLSRAKEKDFFDVAQYAFDINFHSDSRMKHFAFNRGSFPYTVLIEVVREYKTTFFLPVWYPQPSPEVAVQEAVLIASHPVDLAFRYQTYKLPTNFKHTAIPAEKSNTEIFTVSNIKSFKPQPYSRKSNFSLPAIQFSPSDFELMKYKGNMTTWKSLGKFVYELNEGRNELPEDKKALVKEMIDGVTDPYKKIDILYRYLQQNTRYFANVFGIAGWQTFDAKSVAHSGYGDCKGLTNYLMAMLKEADITAYSTLVYAGESDYLKIDPKFPGNIFNHVVLCVPMQQDTVWLECTSQTLPTGYLGSFTQDRWALITTPEGGILQRTPTYDLNDNFISRKVNLKIANEKLLQVTMDNTYSGLLQEDLFQLIKSDDNRQIRNQVNRKFAFPSYVVDEYTYSDQMKSGIPRVQEHVLAQVTGALSQSGNRQFLQLNWLSNPMTNIYQEMERTESIVLDRSFTITDTIVVPIPSGIEVEHLPASFNLEQAFGKFTFEVVQEGDQVVVIRHFEQYKGVYEPSAYEAYQKMYQQINGSNSNSNIVLVQQ